MAKIPEWPEGERPRERLLAHGPEPLADAELLAIILRTGSGGATALDLARHLLHKYHGFRGLDARSPAELCQETGVGPAKAAQIKAALEIGKRLFREQSRVGDKVASSADVYALVRGHIRDLPREVFIVLFLTSRNKLLDEKTVFEGSLTESVVSPREVVYEALSRQAAAVVFVHNHPSGDPSPSQEDKSITKMLKDACQLVGITVLDHVIIGKDSYFSFADEGLL
ncbi:MAG: DNA repair protein RadC [bacterium]|nr:DNA repair protein RadC [bacterium]